MSGLKLDAVHASREPRLRRALLVAVLVLIVAEWALIVGLATQINPPHALDFSVYYAAASLLRHNPNANLYSAQDVLNAASIYGSCPIYFAPEYLYPPIFAIALEPLTLISCAQALAVWTLVSALMWALSAALMAKLLLRRWGTASRLGGWALVIVCCIAFWPAYPGLFLGQVHTLILLLLTAAIWFDENGRPFLAGAALAVATLIMPLPGLVLVYYLVHGRWAVIGGAAVTSAAILAIMSAVTSVATVMRYFAIVFGATAVKEGATQNPALAAYIGPLGWIVTVLGLALYLAIIVLRRRGDQSLGLAFTLGSMLIISPFLWSFFLVWLLPAFVLLLGASDIAQHWRPWLYATIAVIFLLMATPFFPPGKMIALLAFCVLSGALYWRSASPARRPAPSAAALT